MCSLEKHSLFDAETVQAIDATIREQDAAALSRRIWDNMQATKEILRNADGRPIGFTYKTLGGFFRGTQYGGISAGPFSTRQAAIEFVECVNYEHG